MDNDRGNSRIEAQILGPEEIDRAITRIAHEILESNKGSGGLVLAGIVNRGPAIADRIRKVILRVEGVDVPVGRLDVTFHRDDQATKRSVASEISEMPVPVDSTTVVLVDDVLYTGRTVRAALDELVDFGRPGAVRLAVLVDRGHRELPIRPDFVGKNIPTAPGQMVKVMLEEIDGEDAVFLVRKESLEQ